MSNNIDTSINPQHYLKFLMGLDAIEISELFTPILNRNSIEDSEFLENLDTKLADLMFEMDKRELSEKGLRSHNSSVLLTYLYNTQLIFEMNKRTETLKKYGDNLESSHKIIEILLTQQRQSVDSDKKIAKAYFSLKEEAKTLANELENNSTKLSNNAKKSNPTPPNTVDYFYICAEKVIELDTGNRLYLKDVTELARNELLDKVADYKLEWKKEDPFKFEWFHKQLKDYPSLPEYLRSNKGKNEALRKETINNIKIHLGS